MPLRAICEAAGVVQADGTSDLARGLGPLGIVRTGLGTYRINLLPARSLVFNEAFISVEPLVNNISHSVTFIDAVTYEVQFGSPEVQVTSFFMGTDYDASLGDYRVLDLGASGSGRFTFIIPDDFNSLIDIRTIASPEAGANGPGKDIDLFSEYGNNGEVINNHAESDVVSTFEIAAVALTWGGYSLSSVFSTLAAQDRCGVRVVHNALGASVSYIGIELTYQPASALMDTPWMFEIKRVTYGETD